MSASKWAYSPEKCDGRPCPGDCDGCPIEIEKQTELFPDAVLCECATRFAAVVLWNVKNNEGFKDYILDSIDAMTSVKLIPSFLHFLKEEREMLKKENKVGDLDADNPVD